MATVKIDIKHYNRRGEEINISLPENKNRIEKIVEKVIYKTLPG